MEQLGSVTRWFFAALSLGMFVGSCEGAATFPYSQPPAPVGEAPRSTAREAAIPLPAGTALLERGNHVVSGLPGLGENAFKGLYGEYLLSGGSGNPVRVWASAEPIHFSPKLWTQGRRGALVVYSSIEDGLWAVDGGSEANLKGWSVFFSFGANSSVPASVRDAFIGNFIGSLSQVFAGARTDYDVSLPAILD